MNKAVLENIIKNIIILVVLGIAYPSVRESFIGTDPAVAGNLLVAASIIAVTSCFGNFAFTYGTVSPISPLQRMNAHFTTGILMLVIGLSLEMSLVLSRILIGPVLVLDCCWALLYLASVSYDFWDLQRMIRKKA